MIDIVLLAARLLFVALLYLFLFAIMRTGVNQVSGANKKGKVWHIEVEKGPKELRGLNIAVTGPVVIGRAPGSDIVIGAGYVSGRHARLQTMGPNLFIEDLGSKNGTAVNGSYINGPTSVKNNDRIQIGDVDIRVRYE